MSFLFWLSNQQFRQIGPHLHTDVWGVPLADDRLVLSGIINHRSRVRLLLFCYLRIINV